MDSFYMCLLLAGVHFSGGFVGLWDILLDKHEAAEHVKCLNLFLRIKALCRYVPRWWVAVANLNASDDTALLAAKPPSHCHCCAARLPLSWLQLGAQHQDDLSPCAARPHGAKLRSPARRVCHKDRGTAHRESNKHAENCMPSCTGRALRKWHVLPLSTNT